MSRKKALVPVIVLIITLFASCSIQQRYNDESDFTVVVHDEKTVEITGYVGTSKDVRIPPRIEGLPVTAIGKDAFSRKWLTSVVIPKGVTTIGRSAFYGNKLTRVTIPGSVINMDEWVFGDNELTGITISNGVTTIGGHAFEGNKLTGITIPRSVTHIEGHAFSSNELTSVTIPNNVTYIGDFAFFGNNLTKIIIPSSITSIEGYVFAYNLLTRITIAEGIVSIGNNAFANNGLTEITIPKSVISIGSDVFDGHRGVSRNNNNITKVTIGDNVDMKYNSFHGFSYFYSVSVRKRGGTYIFDNYHWSPQDKTIPVFSFLSSYEDNNFPNISFIADMPDLEEVDLSYNDFLTDITPLSGLTKLKRLRINSCPNIKSFAPISSLSNLETIYVQNLESLELLSSLTNLKNIYLDHNNNYDYSVLIPLRQLEFLYLSYFDKEAEIDLSYIGQLQSLKSLHIAGTAKVKNINALQNLVNLEKLEIRRMGTLDISWMSSLRNLTELEFESCVINNISLLANLPHLVNVIFHGTRVKDIAPLLNSNSIKYIRVFDDDVEAGISDNLRSRFKQKNINLHTPSGGH